MSNQPLDLKGKTIILASGSPRRKMLLEALDIPFSMDVRPIQESYPKTLQASEVAEYLAELKSREWGELKEGELLITADTVVSLNGRILEKPLNDKQAVEMLRELSGETHTVYTGVCLRFTDEKVSFTDRTDVAFRELTETEMTYYVNRYSPFDKAGSYGAQEWLGMVAINEIHGSYFNVMGLPVHRLYTELERLLKNR